jgi:hypothetical protein
MSDANNKPKVLHILGGSVITGTAIDIGIGGLVLLNIAVSYASDHSFSEEPRRATFISLAMIGLAILGLFFGVRLLRRGGTTSMASSLANIVLPILFSIVASPLIALLVGVILMSLS